MPGLSIIPPPQRDQQRKKAVNVGILERPDGVHFVDCDNDLTPIRVLTAAEFIAANAKFLSNDEIASLYYTSEARTSLHPAC